MALGRGATRGGARGGSSPPWPKNGGHTIFPESMSFFWGVGGGVGTNLCNKPMIIMNDTSKQQHKNIFLNIRV